MKRTADYAVRRFVDWIVRRRPIGLAVMKVGLGLVIAGLGGLAFELVVQTKQVSFNFSFNVGDGVVLPLAYFAVVLGFILILGGMAWEWRRYIADERRLERKRVIVLEVRGLRGLPGTPLVDAVPAEIEGRREPWLVDLRQIHDGEIMQPEAAVGEVVSLPKDLKRRITGGDRSDVTLVYGGMASVPLTFLTGVLMDDEGAIEVMDWHRTLRQWQILDADDDGKRFNVSGLEHVPRGATSVALAVTTSEYEVELAGIPTVLPVMPLVDMRLEGHSFDAHWSKAKQQALGRQFLEVVVALGNLGVRDVHLFFVAQNSVAFAFGSVYDKRNLPRITVYQYEQGKNIVFPWGIQMPVAGVGKPGVVHNVDQRSEIDGKA